MWDEKIHLRREGGGRIMGKSYKIKQPNYGICVRKIMKKYLIKDNKEQTIYLNDSGEYVVELVGEGARVKILGGWKLGGKDKLDVLLTIRHKNTHTFADTILKAVVDDEAMATIRGRIIVEKGAQQTESFLRESVLLISSKARAVAIPDLEIEANEVKCSHAATVSKVDEEQLYYLTSRGISRFEAQEMIVEGFLKEVWDVSKISDSSHQPDLFSV